MQVEDDRIRQVSYPQPSRQGYIEEHHSQSPPIKAEPMWPTLTNAPVFHSTGVKTSLISSQAQEINFGTEVDTLMKAIQAKQPQAASSAEQIRPVVGAFHPPSLAQATSQIGVYASREETKYKLAHSTLQEESSSPKNPKKRYQCAIASCNKSFYQKTHLDIHERAHTGVKPYTHERRHTGERPFQCEICGKRFAQRGNLRAHKIIHDQSKSKPYCCRLDDCTKQFTQLGNLKSHQNKFHIDTIRNLTAKFASIKDGDIVHAGDKELWDYFANLYKNSNKGIKGRGKDRKVGSASSSSMALNSGIRSFGVGNMGGNVSGRGDGGQYEMFDVDDGSQSGHSHSGSAIASSVGTCYEDAPFDGYED
ncbi:putative asparagine-rich zinc finger protein AZF1 [Leptodontidium sp. MPI-SDFR-AT-0119]|nr:putative asparagine-rich zinc finger protein AZF1 [Leptodontidium sp. MPI-SDFR-AT-0119]